MGLLIDSAVEFARPAVLGAIPVAALALWLLVVRRGTGGDTEEGRDDDQHDREAGRRARLALFASRFVVVACLLVAAAGPTTVTTATTPGDPQVTMVVDDSSSMAVYEPVADDLETRIEEEGVAVERVTVATGNRSRIGEGLVANLRPNGSLLVVSDGQVTGGASLSRAATLAESVNASVNRVELSANRSDARVAVTGPRKASVGVESRFGVRVAGIEAVPTGREVTVTIDGEEVLTRQVPEDGSFVVTHNFTEVGPHRVTARLSGEDAYAVNDAARKTVQVVEQPKILYVSRGDYAFEEYLRELYDVTRKESVPADLSDYYAVVVHDVAAPDLGNVSALQEYVISGGGLAVVGGERAYEKGEYGNSRISSLLPVTVGGSTGEKSRIVLAVDVSGSAKSGMRVQKALALDVLSQLGDRNQVGIVAFNGRAYRVSGLKSLESGRERLQRRIRSLQSGGATRIDKGLLGASKLLGDEGGTVILLSDGRDAPKPVFGAAERLADGNVRVVSVGVGNVNENVLRGVAERTDGTFLLANETNRLRLQFGGANRRYSGDHAVVVDDGHFVTSGVRTTASLPSANDVSVKESADLLVATGYGAPAVATWRFGLGRVVSVTAYGADGSLGDLLSKPDSLLLSRSVNWAVGDPQRKATGVVAAPDTRVGDPTTVVYSGEQPPTVEESATDGSDGTNLSFSEVAPGRYEATVVPAKPGYRTVGEAAFAVDSPAEYAALGESSKLQQVVEQTDGRAFDSDSASSIASAVERQATRRRQVERSWDWAALLAGLLVFVGEVCVRRFRRHRGRGVIP